MLNSAVILLMLLHCIFGEPNMANVLLPLSQKTVANISNGCYWGSARRQYKKMCDVQLWHQIGMNRNAAERRCQLDSNCLGLMLYAGHDSRWKATASTGWYQGCGSYGRVTNNDWDTIVKPTSCYNCYWGSAKLVRNSGCYSVLWEQIGWNRRTAELRCQDDSRCLGLTLYTGSDRRWRSTESSGWYQGCGRYKRNSNNDWDFITMPPKCSAPWQCSVNVVVEYTSEAVHMASQYNHTYSRSASFSDVYSSVSGDISGQMIGPSYAGAMSASFAKADQDIQSNELEKETLTGWTKVHEPGTFQIWRTETITIYVNQQRLTDIKRTMTQAPRHNKGEIELLNLSKNFLKNYYQTDGSAPFVHISFSVPPPL